MTLYDRKYQLGSPELSLRSKLNARGLVAFEDIAKPEIEATGDRLTSVAIVGEMHAIGPDGFIIRGVEVLPEFHDARGFKWLPLPIRWRLTRPLAKFGCRIVATVQRWLSGFRPAEWFDACHQLAMRQLASVAFLIFSAAWIGGCGTSSPPHAAPFRPIHPTTLQSQPASKQAFPTATEESEMKKPFMIGEARLPDGFPPPGPVDEVIIKQYPKCRAAVVQATAVEGGENKMFGSLFKHIKSNQIAMSTPVDLTWSDPDDSDHAPRETAMAFIYGDPTIGKPGPDGLVQVVDLPARTMLSFGVRGSYSQKNFVAGIKQLKSWLAMHANEYRVAGPPRYLGYNSPFVPWFMKFGEVQLPIFAVR